MTKYITRGVVAAAVFGLVALGYGCITRQPMTESEFIGFCSSVNPRGACDSIGICQDYLQTVGQPQKSLEVCMAGCEKVKQDLKNADPVRCGATVRAGNDWCQRYCRTLYPQ